MATLRDADCDFADCISHTVPTNGMGVDNLILCEYNGFSTMQFSLIFMPWYETPV